MPRSPKIDFEPIFDRFWFNFGSIWGSQRIHFICGQAILGHLAGRLAGRPAERPVEPTAAYLANYPKTTRTGSRNNDSPLMKFPNKVPLRAFAIASGRSLGQAQSPYLDRFRTIFQPVLIVCNSF